MSAPAGQSAPEPIRPDAGIAEPLLVEDLLLLLFQPDSGTIAGENILFYVLGGAVLADLGLRGLATPEARTLSTRVHVGGERPDDELLRRAWDYLERKPRDAQTVLAAIGPELRAPVLDRLVADGHLRRTPRKVLGFIPSETLELDSERRAELMARVRAALVDGAEVDARTAASIALISASGTLPWFHREIPWGSAVAERATRYQQGDWAGGAAAEAVVRTMTAVIVNAMIAANVAATATR